MADTFALSRSFPKKLFLWSLLIFSATIAEVAVLNWVQRWNYPPRSPTSPDTIYGVMDGRYALAWSHETSGKYPYEAWFALFPGSFLGFNLLIASHGLSRAYMKVTMVTVPCWFLVALGGFVTFACARKLGMRLVWFPSRYRSGFEPVIRK